MTKGSQRFEEEWGRYMGGFEGRQERGKCNKIIILKVKYKNISFKI